MADDIVMVILSGKKINQYIYDKKYIYSLEIEKLLEPKRTDKSLSGNYWQDKYFLHPGKYLIIEANVDDIKNTCAYKCLTIFTKEDYLSNKRMQFPDVALKVFKRIYQTGGLETIEWEGEIPDWVELPCECISEIENKKEEYKQPKEVEDKLSLLSMEDEGKKPSAVQYLIQKKGKSRI